MAVFLITGGAGFIGSSFVRRLIDEGHTVINFDLLSYAGNLLNIDGISSDRHTFVRGSINDRALVAQLLLQHKPSVVVNFAAETHVDRSIKGPDIFLHTNVLGTYELLAATLAYWQSLSTQARKNFRFVQISTDEVYGSIATGRCTERSPYAPVSPYAASKAAADHFVRSYWATYGLPTLVTNASNNYGSRQFPEKLIPKMILSAIAGRTMGVYGDGLHRRDWLHVSDHCRALLRIIERGRPGEAYNIGGGEDVPNIAVVNAICDHLDRARPGKVPYRNLIEFVTDRPGHDRRYAVDTKKLENELGWRPEVNFESGLAQTVDWYIENSQWCEQVSVGIDHAAVWSAQAPDERR